VTPRILIKFARIFFFLNQSLFFGVSQILWMPNTVIGQNIFLVQLGNTQGVEEEVYDWTFLTSWCICQTK
jgi:hypothetical protein